MRSVKPAIACAYALASSALAVAEEASHAATEATSTASGSITTLLVLAVLGALGYLFYSVGLLPGGGDKSGH